MPEQVLGLIIPRLMKQNQEKILNTKLALPKKKQEKHNSSYE